MCTGLGCQAGPFTSHCLTTPVRSELEPDPEPNQPRVHDFQRVVEASLYPVAVASY